jgi:hypothetical protein
MRRLLVAGSSLTLAALMLGACGTGAGRTDRTHISLTSHPISGARPATATRPVIARRAAARILREAKLPPGSRRVTRPPSKYLRAPASSPADPDLVDLHRFEVVPESVSALLAYLKVHPEKGSTFSGEGYAGDRSGTYEWEIGFQLPPVGTVLDSRQLQASVVRLGHDKTGLRLDAEVTWLPRKPSGDPIPADVRVVTVWRSKGFNPGELGHGPVTTAKKSLVGDIRRDVNTLGVEPPGIFSCPADFGQVLHIVFRTAPGTAPVAVVEADVSGCGIATVIRHGQAVRPALAGRGLVAEVERLLGWHRGA